jgi:RNA polymerase sigma-70 factor (ECF subfamily)
VSAPVDGDAALLARLRAGDEAAFVELVDQYHAPMLRLASTFVPNRAVAEEVVQDTWLGVVKGIDRFEGRSSLKTWLFRIVVNRARTTGGRERRSVPADLGREPAVAARRFDERGHWVDPPVAWVDDVARVDDRIAAQQTVDRVKDALAALPDAQRQVLLLRDFEGVPADEVCGLLGISDGNQRVLLHRGRSRMRTALEQALGAGGATEAVG